MTTQAKNHVLYAGRHYTLLGVFGEGWEEVFRRRRLDTGDLPPELSPVVWFDVRTELDRQGFRMAIASTACWDGHTYELRVTSDVRLTRVCLERLAWGTDEEEDDDDRGDRLDPTRYAELEARQANATPEERIALTRAFLASPSSYAPRPKREQRPAPTLFGKLPTTPMVENGGRVTYEDLDLAFPFTGELVLGTVDDWDREVLRLRFNEGLLLPDSTE